MTRFRQQRYLRTIDKELGLDQVVATQAAHIVYGTIAVFLNLIRLQALLQAPSWAAAFQLLWHNLFLLGVLNLVMLLPVLSRFLLLLNWFLCQRELVLHFASRSRVPPSYLALPEALLVELMSMTTAAYRLLRQVLLQRPPHLNLRRKAPLLLFQRANLLVSP
jgi:hypothetical protein